MQNEDSIMAIKVREVEAHIEKNKEKYFYGLLLLIIAKWSLADSAKQDDTISRLSLRIANSLVEKKSDIIMVAEALKQGLNVESISDKFKKSVSAYLRTFIFNYATTSHLLYDKAIIEVFINFNQLIHSKDTIDLSNNMFADFKNTTFSQKEDYKYSMQRIGLSESEREKMLDKVKWETKNNIYWINIYEDIMNGQKRTDRILKKVNKNPFYFILFIIGLIYFGYEFLEGFATQLPVPVAVLRAMTLDLPVFAAMLLVVVISVVGVSNFRNKSVMAIAKASSRSLYHDLMKNCPIKIRYISTHKKTVSKTSSKSEAEKAEVSEKVLAIFLDPEQKFKENSNVYTDSRLNPDPKPKVKTRPILSNSNSEKSTEGLPKLKLDGINWEIKELGINFVAYYDPKRDQLFADKEGLRPSPISPVITKDNKKLFLYIPESCLNNNDDPAISREKMQESRHEADLRLFTDGTPRTAKLGFADKVLDVTLKREVLPADRSKKFRIFGFDIKSGDHVLCLAFLPYDAMHDKASLQKTSFGKVILTTADVFQESKANSAADSADYSLQIK